MVLDPKQPKALDGTLLPVKRGRGRPPTVGAYSKRVLLPVTDDKRKLIRDLIEGKDTLISDTDRIACELLARALAKIEVIDRWLAEKGLFDDAGQPQPVLKMYYQALSTAARLCGDLGLTPTSRARLGLNVAHAEGLAEQMGEAAKGKKKGKGDGAEED